MQSALTQISVVAIGYAVLVAVAALYAVARWRARPPWLVSLVWMLEFLVVVRALAGLGGLTGDDRPDALVTHVGYLAASVCVLPIVVSSLDTEDEGAWSAAVIGVAAIGVAVMVLRLQQTQ